MRLQNTALYQCLYKSWPINVSKTLFQIQVLNNRTGDMTGHELYEGTNNTPVNTCQLYIIIAKKSTPLIFIMFLYSAFQLHQWVESRYHYCKRIRFIVGVSLFTLFLGGNERYPILMNYYGQTGQTNIYICNLFEWYVLWHTNYI